MILTNSPGVMCEGEAGQMFAITSDRSSILHLDCSTEHFKLLQVIPATTTAVKGMAYIPGHRLITLS